MLRILRSSPSGRAVLGVVFLGLSAVLALVVPGSMLAAGAVSLGTVQGTVTDSDGHAVAGARVGIFALERPFRITDAGGHYTLPDIPFNANGYDVQLLRPCRRDQRKAVVVNGNETVNFTVPASPDKDAFGYTCRTSTEAFVPGTMALNLTGDDTQLTGGLPFPFRFYGVSYSTVTISSNGFLSFTGAATAFDNKPLPDNESPGAAIYPFWDDLYVPTGGDVFVGVTGFEPLRRLQVEWRGVVRQEESGNPRALQLTFEVILIEDGNRIIFNYRSIPTSASGQLARGSSATVGIENENSTMAFQRSFNQPYLDDGYAIEFVAPK